ncbi:hypothetical protein TrRE_jg2790 [Triparma retinervis]|uniref:glycerol-3-phosphate dehydrogenase n=1 Tax=Triparma retinervis TaxID=2557542 RepID=A0A9W7EAD2_9STRA|nr:hypothetical protein TrRE_jg2790 [Triparma retinervis]
MVPRWFPYCVRTVQWSTKLIHGGIRYLENAFKNLDYGQYELVKEALSERAHMLKAAPYMNKPLPIMIPMYVENWYDPLFIPYYLAGAKVYDFVASLTHGETGVPGSYFVGRDEAKYKFPMLKDDGLWGAIVYYDGQMNDARMALHLALTSCQSGACVASRVEVEGVVKDKKGKTVGAKVRDKETGEKFVVKAKCVVNATGPFSDGIRKMDDPKVQNIIKGAAGVHVVLPDHYSPDNCGLIVPKTSDGRVLFFLPWEGGTISGTTDSGTEITMEPSATDEEVGFIIEEANKYLKADKSVNSGDVRAAWSGIRPLVMDPNKKDTKSISRTHVIEVSKSNMITIAGGKWTTYRRMAEEVVDEVLKVNPELSKGKQVRKCVTEGRGIIGADRMGVVAGGKFDRINVTLREDYGLPLDVSRHLVSNYGTRALQIAELVKSGGRYSDSSLVHPVYGAKRLQGRYPFLLAEVTFACRQEYALTVQDVLARRTRLAFIDSEAALGCVDQVASIMAKELGWSSRRQREETEAFKKFAKTMNMDDKGKGGW